MTTTTTTTTAARATVTPGPRNHPPGGGGSRADRATGSWRWRRRDTRELDRMSPAEACREIVRLWKAGRAWRLAMEARDADDGGYG